MIETAKQTQRVCDSAGQEFARLGIVSLASSLAIYADHCDDLLEYLEERQLRTMGAPAVFVGERHPLGGDA